MARRAATALRRPGFGGLRWGIWLDRRSSIVGQPGGTFSAAPRPPRAIRRSEVFSGRRPVYQVLVALAEKELVLPCLAAVSGVSPDQPESAGLLYLGEIGSNRPVRTGRLEPISPRCRRPALSGWSGDTPETAARHGSTSSFSASATST